MEKKKIRKILTIFTLLFAFGYLLNFFWEAQHAVFLYQGHDFSASKYIPMISYVSFIDSLLILGMYLIISILWKNILWIKNIDKKNIFTFVFIGLLFAIIIEFRAIHILNKWSYNKLMPTVFGLGLSPLLQLSILGLLSLLITERLIYNTK